MGQRLDDSKGGVFASVVLASALLAFSPALADETPDPQPGPTPHVAASDAGAEATPQRWSIQAQSTFVAQFHPAFTSPFRGPNSLDPAARGDETWDVTLYAGVRLWRGMELWANPEIDQGFGLSDTLGVAGFPSGEAYKVGKAAPYFRMQRLFLRQTIDLGGERRKVDTDLNQLGGAQTADRIVITLGKFSVVDVFDTNAYAHDPRNDFLNWTLIDTGTFDYAADAWGYTPGLAVELYKGNWVFRQGLFDMSNEPNSTKFDPTFQQFQMIEEVERGYSLFGKIGKVRVTGFLSRARMASFKDAIAFGQATGGLPQLAPVRRYQSRGGVGLNVEQQIDKDLGVFVRLGWADGTKEPFEFTDVDRTGAAGVSLKGSRWGRENDTAGAGFVVNDIIPIHQQFLNDGGLGILVGDGKLPQPGLEKIFEGWYSVPVVNHVRFTFDYQFIDNPAYNTQRGPVNVLGARLHAQF